MQNTVLLKDRSESTPPAHAARTFRLDINGLRAWAVIAVVLFHFRALEVRGGFVGVDVFFVISGFLMTGIAVRGLEQGNFSILTFILARAQRILPALLVLVATLIVMGYFFLAPPDYRVLSTHGIHSLLFLTNIKFWKEAGYFDTSSQEKWLLHTWSLSAEWQFYLILPIVLMFVWRIRPHRSTLVIVCGFAFALSLGASIWTTAHDPSSAFFLLHTRAWEMLAGGLVYFLGLRQHLSPRYGAMTARLGLGMIALSILLFTEASAWPGWRAMLPVGGAMLILLANRPFILTNHSSLQWIGDRSYSIYLWHWPVVVLLEYAQRSTNLLAVGIGIASSVVLGGLSYTLVETRSRRALSRMGQPLAAMTICVACLCVLAPAMLVWRMGGIEERFGPEVKLAAEGALDRNPDHARCQQREGTTSPSCLFGAPQLGVIVLGDSHAGVLMSAITQAASGTKRGVQQWSYDSCIYLPGMRHVDSKRLSRGSDCFGFNQQRNAELEKVPKDIPVLLIGRYARYAMGPNEMPVEHGVPEVYFGTDIEARTTPAFLRRFGDAIIDSACELARSRTVYMMRPLPEMPVNVPLHMSRRLALGLDPVVSISLSEYERRNGWIREAQDQASKRCGVRLLDPIPYLCNNGICPGSVNGRPLFYDHGHLNQYGNTFLIPMFRQIFDAH